MDKISQYKIFIRNEEKTAIQKRGTNIQLAKDNGEYYKERNAEYPSSCVGFGPTHKTMLIKGDLDKLEKTFFNFDGIASYLERKRRKPNTYTEEVKQGKQIEKIVENASTKLPTKPPNTTMIAKWYAQYDQQNVPLDSFMQTSAGRAIKAFHQFIKDAIV